MQQSETALWIWRHLSVRLPRDWEMLQFTRNLQFGRCAYADRYDFRFELSWRAVPGPPDTDRMLSDYAAELLRNGCKEPKRIRHGAWAGLQGGGGGVPASRFGRYFPGEACLVEAVFRWTTGADRDLAAGILDSIREEPAGADGSRRWRAFGMDLLVPRGLALQSCRVEPARAEMTFENKGGSAALRAKRQGMLSEWFDGRVADRVRQAAAADLAVARESAVRHNGHHVVCVRGRVRRGRVALPGRRALGAYYGWICPRDGRLYELQSKGVEEADRPVPGTSDRLGCCSGKGING